MNKFQQYLEISKNEKKGINLFVSGGNLVGVVVNISSDGVELTSNEYSKIYVPLENILAVALS